MSRLFFMAKNKSKYLKVKKGQSIIKSKIVKVKIKGDDENDM